MFYLFEQNNSGGSFVVNDKLCHRLFIEADSEYEAVEKAEELGCYWDGVAYGLDCSCCGDRWCKDWLRPVNVEKYSTEGYEVSVYDGIYYNTKEEWNKRYGMYAILEEPTYQQTFTSRRYAGKIKFDNIEEYAQFLANEYGWTIPDVRFFYKDGTVTEIFSNRR